MIENILDAEFRTNVETGIQNERLPFNQQSIISIKTKT